MITPETLACLRDSAKCAIQYNRRAVHVDPNELLALLALTRLLLDQAIEDDDEPPTSTQDTAHAAQIHS